MTKQKNNASPSPEVTANTGTTGVSGLSPDAAAAIADGPNPTRSAQALRSNLFLVQSNNQSAAVAEKVQLMGQVRQSLAHAADLYREGDDKAKEAAEVADKAAVGLFNGRVNGLIAADELSGVLGDVFGYKPKKDGTPGKTPDGQGEHIRKRVVRLTKAAEFVAGQDADRFFDGLDADSADDDGNTIAGTVQRVRDGGMSIWTAYDVLSRIKRENVSRRDAAFDAKRIMAIADSLAGPEAGDIVRNDPKLIAAYADLIKIVLMIGDNQGEPVEPTTNVEQSPEVPAGSPEAANA